MKSTAAAAAFLLAAAALALAAGPAAAGRCEPLVARCVARTLDAQLPAGELVQHVVCRRVAARRYRCAVLIIRTHGGDVGVACARVIFHSALHSGRGGMRQVPLSVCGESFAAMHAGRRLPV